MKVLYCNPVFLDYRLPFYCQINKILEGNFHVLYSKQRYLILNRIDLYNKIENELGENAHPLTTDYLFDTNSMSFRMTNIEKGHHIPFTFGLIRKIHKIKPDVLITEGFFQWTPLILLYSILFKKPLFIGYERTCHTERNTSKIKIWHRKLTNKFVTGYLVNGSETLKYLKSLGIPEKKIHIVGMNADSKGLSSSIQNMSLLEKQKIKSQIISDTGLLYLFSGKLTPRKGVTYLLTAWLSHIKKYPHDKLILIGTGENYTALTKQYNEGSIIFKGFVDYNLVYKYYAIADVFILPTLEDNWSLVVPEAMSCGLPVATSIYNGCAPELVKKDINGIVFDPLSQESLINALDYFHHQDLTQMGKKSKELEIPFNTENCAKRFCQTINNYSK